MRDSSAAGPQETGLTLETACDYLRLSTQLRGAHAAVQPLLDAGRRRLLASFADLDDVWERDEGQRSFVGLPLEAVQVPPHRKEPLHAAHAGAAAAVAQALPVAALSMEQGACHRPFLFRLLTLLALFLFRFEHAR